MKSRAQILERLRGVGLRPTRQRLALAELLLEPGDRHVTAESLHAEAMSAGIQVSLATVYNTLHQFTESGLLREIVVNASRSYFDTNTSNHHHFYFEQSGRLTDIPLADVVVSEIPEGPEGTRVKSIDIVVRVEES